MGARYVLDEGTSGAPTIASALENWCKLLAEVPGWTAESFLARYHLWNMRDEDIAKLMDGVTKSGVLEAEAKPDAIPGPARMCSPPWSTNVRFDRVTSASCPFFPSERTFISAVCTVRF